MPPLKREEPELLPGADLDQDCQTAEVDPAELVADIEDEAESEHLVTWTDLKSDDDAAEPLAGIAGWRTPRSKWAATLERMALTIERPVNRFVGLPQLNPLYHTGTIAVFLLIIVGITGLYLFFFFQYGFEASYAAVERMEGQFIARMMCAAHRYASGALVITVLLHAFRTLFLEQFRGPRWLAWLTGIGMTALL